MPGQSRPVWHNLEVVFTLKDASFGGHGQELF